MGAQQPDDLSRFIRQAEKLCDALDFDESGHMVGGQWMGGNGGLLSRDTMREKDQLRREIDAWKQWHKP